MRLCSGALDPPPSEIPFHNSVTGETHILAVVSAYKHLETLAAADGSPRLEIRFPDSPFCPLRLPFACAGNSFPALSSTGIVAVTREGLLRRLIGITFFDTVAAAHWERSPDPSWLGPLKQDLEVASLYEGGAGVQILSEPWSRPLLTARIGGGMSYVALARSALKHFGRWVSNHGRIGGRNKERAQQESDGTALEFSPDGFEAAAAADLTPSRADGAAAETGPP